MREMRNEERWRGGVKISHQVIVELFISSWKSPTSGFYRGLDFSPSEE